MRSLHELHHLVRLHPFSLQMLVSSLRIPFRIGLLSIHIVHTGKRPVCLEEPIRHSGFLCIQVSGIEWIFMVFLTLGPTSNERSNETTKTPGNASCLDARLSEESYGRLCGRQSPRNFDNCTDAAKMTPYLSGWHSWCENWMPCQRRQRLTVT